MERREAYLGEGEKSYKLPFNAYDAYRYKKIKFLMTQRDITTNQENSHRSENINVAKSFFRLTAQ